jgi:hypothetical protein
MMSFVNNRKILTYISNFSGTRLLILVVLSITARAGLMINGRFSLFSSGSDAPAYFASSLDLSTLGWFSPSIRYLPDYAAGYPLFLSIFRILWGEHWWIFIQIIQHALFIFATLKFFKILKGKIIGIAPDLILLLLLFMPVFLYSPSEIMYESLIASSLMLMFYYFFRLLNSTEFTLNLVLLTVITSFAIFIQPKIVLVEALMFGLFVLNGKTKIAILSLVSIISIVFLSVRNYIIYGAATLSTNFGTAIRVGNENLNIPFTENLDPGAPSYDKQYISTAYKYLFLHPLEFLTRTAKQFLEFFGPLNGAGLPSGRGSTWHHGLDSKRFFLLISDESNLNVLYVFEIIVLFICFLIGILGVYYLGKNREKLLLSMMLGPIVSFICVHVISDGDARYRIPVMPFCFSLLVIGAVTIVGKIFPHSKHDQRFI